MVLGLSVYISGVQPVYRGTLVISYLNLMAARAFFNKFDNDSLEFLSQNPKPGVEQDP